MPHSTFTFLNFFTDHCVLESTIFTIHEAEARAPCSSFCHKSDAFSCEIFKSLKTGVAVALSFCTMHAYSKMVLLPFQPVFPHQGQDAEVAFIGGPSTYAMYYMGGDVILRGLKLMYISTLKIMQFTKFTKTTGHLY